MDIHPVNNYIKPISAHIIFYLKVYHSCHTLLRAASAFPCYLTSFAFLSSKYVDACYNSQQTRLAIVPHLPLTGFPILKLPFLHAVNASLWSKVAVPHLFSPLCP